MENDYRIEDGSDRPVLFVVQNTGKTLGQRYDIDERWLAHQYIVKGFSKYRIAKMLGISQVTVAKLIAEHKIERGKVKEEENEVDYELPKNMVSVIYRISDLEAEEE